MRNEGKHRKCSVFGLTLAQLLTALVFCGCCILSQFWRSQVPPRSHRARSRLRRASYFLEAPGEGLFLLLPAARGCPRPGRSPLDSSVSFPTHGGSMVTPGPPGYSLKMS